MSIFLNSFEPLVKFKQCHKAIEKYGIPPFVDRSCRREPDFESQFPMISSLCRGAVFVTRLNRNDIVIYRSNKGKYRTDKSHWLIVAILKVLEILPNHEDAAKWYRERFLSLPSNCMVSGTRPLPRTHTIPLSKTRNKFTCICKWDYQYKQRSKRCSRIAICAPLFLELYNPPTWTEEKELKTFKRQLMTLNPPRISESEYKTFLELADIRLKKPQMPW